MARIANGRKFGRRAVAATIEIAAKGGSLKALILAGGQGARLRPYTTVLPKPLMPVGDYPIAETIIRQLSYYGVREVTFAVGYLQQLMEAYFGDGARWGVRISYLREEYPLGTAGPLAELNDFGEPLLVMNGDILTDLEFARFFQAHLDSGAEISIAAYRRSVKIDLGVLGADASGLLQEYIEKPTYDFQVSMGIYAISPAVLELMTPGERCDFPDLVRALLMHKRPVKIYPFEGIWLDIGRSEDYLAAADVYHENLARLLPDSSGVARAIRETAT